MQAKDCIFLGSYTNIHLYVEKAYLDKLIDGVNPLAYK
jgi:hypothetical protein